MLLKQEEIAGGEYFELYTCMWDLLNKATAFHIYHNEDTPHAATVWLFDNSRAPWHRGIRYAAVVVLVFFVGFADGKKSVTALVF